MPSGPKPPIVVGVSPTTGSIAAVEWALDQSRRLRRPLVAVTAWQVPRGATPPGLTVAAQNQAVERLAAQAATQLAKTVRAITGDASTVQQRVERGTVAAVLLRAAEGAELLVIGPPRPGELTKLRPTLVAPQLVYKAHCPVVVMPAETYDGPSRSRIVAGKVAGRVARAAATAGRPGTGIARPPA